MTTPKAFNPKAQGRAAHPGRPIRSLLAPQATPTKSHRVESPSPTLQEKATFLGTVLSSFPEASRASEVLMNYPEYGRQGLPITSSHIESTNKLLNHRVKGTEKFWSRRGAEAMLQLKADTLSDTAPLDTFWRNRPKRMTGQRVCTRSKS